MTKVKESEMEMLGKKMSKETAGKEVFLIWSSQHAFEILERH